MERYPCLGLALEAGARGGTYPAALAAADEEAVGAFLEERIGFLDIPRLLSDALESTSPRPKPIWRRSWQQTPGAGASRIQWIEEH